MALSVCALGDREFASAAPYRNFASRLGLPMPRGRDFSKMDVGETVTGAIDFAAWLPAGVSIASITSFVATNYFPNTGSAFVETQGSPSVGTVPVSEGGSGVTDVAVLQQWTGLAPGVARLTATITTSDGQTLIGWAHQQVQTPD
jgi:hypothetical protein